MTTNDENSSGKLSPRQSLLIWVTGMFLGWGVAVVLVYQLIRTSDIAPTPEASTPVVASDQTAPSLSDIAPAAGDTDPAERSDRADLALPPQER
jgi:hypothetical protein